MEETAPKYGSGGLRQELSARNLSRAGGFEHEVTYSRVPSVIYQEKDGTHGNFLDASYRMICAHPEWRRRFEKRYTAGAIARRWERSRGEMECANSSDALLMNIVCYPRMMHRREVCALLGLGVGEIPVFGYRAQIPLKGGRVDRTEIDVLLGNVMVEAKLTETGFQTAPLRLIERYRDLEEVFDIGSLPVRGEKVESYQLIRGVLAAHAQKRTFAVLCDGRRKDMIERWFQVLSAVQIYELRSRLKVLTWQELAKTLPVTVRKFLDEKYGIL